MPRIPEPFLDCSVYMYKDKKAAEDGDRYGGSGFLVHVPSVHERWLHVYAVTNKHVVDNGYRVVRLNTKEGKVHVIESDPQSWTMHPAGDDIAVFPVPALNYLVRWFSVGISDFISKDVLEEYGIGPGDEIFLIGRLTAADSRQRNSPVVRFGNLSTMADVNEPIMVGSHPQEGFLVECRSLSGFSGSPVFVQVTRDYGYMGKTKAKSALIGAKVLSGPWLLGVDCAHVPLWRPVYDKCGAPTEYKVEANTGIACVIPSWRILDLLNDRELVKERNQGDDKIARMKIDSPIPDSPSTA